MKYEINNDIHFYFPKRKVKKVDSSSYIISTMESLAQMYYFSNYFLKSNFKNVLGSSKNNENGIVPLFKDYMENLWKKEKEKEEFSPKSFLKKLIKISNLSVKEEVDPLIFYNNILEQLNKELNGKDPDIKKYFEMTINIFNYNTELEKFYKDFINNNNSIVSKLLFGIIKLNKTCCFCSETEKNTEYEKFDIIEINIAELCNTKHEEDNSLTKIYFDECIDIYFSNHKEKSKKCDCGKDYFNVTKKIVKCPNYLTFKINWGDFIPNKGFSSSIEYIFPTYNYLDNIDIIELKKDYLDNDNNGNNIKYRLFSTIDYYQKNNIFITKYKIKEEKKDHWYSTWCNNTGKQILSFEDNFTSPVLLFYERIQ